MKSNRSERKIVCKFDLRNKQPKPKARRKWRNKIYSKHKMKRAENSIIKMIWTTKKKRIKVHKVYNRCDTRFIVYWIVDDFYFFTQYTISSRFFFARFPLLSGASFIHTMTYIHRECVCERETLAYAMEPCQMKCDLIILMLSTRICHQMAWNR